VDGVPGFCKDDLSYLPFFLSLISDSKLFHKHIRLKQEIGKLLYCTGKQPVKVFNVTFLFIFFKIE